MSKLPFQTDHVGGSSLDWVKGVADIQYAFVLELRDLGKHGFLLPVHHILPTAEETWQGIAAAVDAITNSTSTPKVQEIIHFVHAFRKNLASFENRVFPSCLLDTLIYAGQFAAQLNIP